MRSFPALEVLAVAPGLRLPRPGVRLPLTAHYTVGRHAENDLVLSSDLVGRRHFLIEQRYGRWWLLHLGATVDTLHNGAPITNAELGHLDVVGIRNVITLRFLTHEEPEAFDEAMEASILRAPDDDARWAVYADWLLEHGAALGERMARPRPEHHGRWLGSLAVDWAEGDLDVAWRHGLPSALVLRRLANDLRALSNPLSTVVRDPVFRFLRSIDLDIEARTRTHLWTAALETLLAPLEGASLPLLGSLRVGPLSAPAPSDAEQALAALRTRRPGLSATFFAVPQPLLLEVLTAPSAVRVMPAPGGTVPISDGMLVGKLPTCGLRVDAPEAHPAAFLAVRFALSDGGWCVEDLFAQSRPYRRLEFALRVNGHEVVSALVRPGDVLELCSGLLVRLGSTAQ